MYDSPESVPFYFRTSLGKVHDLLHVWEVEIFRLLCRLAINGCHD
jgi:hypothetical protein